MVDLFNCYKIASKPGASLNTRVANNIRFEAEVIIMKQGYKL